MKAPCARIGVLAALAVLASACGFPTYSGFDTVQGAAGNAPGASGAGGSAAGSAGKSGGGSGGAQAGSGGGGTSSGGAGHGGGGAGGVGGAGGKGGSVTAGGMGGTSGIGGAGGGGSAGKAGTGGMGGSGGSVTTGCTSDADCASNATNKTCDVAKHACVECTPAKDGCVAGMYCASDDTCVEGCAKDADCAPLMTTGASGAGGAAGSGGAGTGGSGGSGTSGAAGVAGSGGAAGATVSLTCDTTKHLCVGCTDDAQCPPGATCDATSSTCTPGCSPSHDCPTTRTCCGTTCIDPKNDPMHCGGCLPCDPANATGMCASGVCTIVSCTGTFEDCNGKADDGCESDVTSDPANCGTCGMPCPTPFNVKATCKMGVCGTTTGCAPGFGDCDADPSNGCEVNLLTTVSHCGDCATACSYANATAACTTGACSLKTCNTGYADCNMTDADGCETQISADPSNCGACGTICNLPNANAVCASGQCKIDTCAAPWQSCDTSQANGCETNTNTDANDCGACAHVCTLAHATAACSNGGCTIAMCDPGFDDCNGNPDDGCETDITSAANCGTCGNACNATNGTASCSMGVCGITCKTGYANCDGDLGNGCEVNTSNNVQSCGTCNNVCSAAGGTPSCTNGTCGFSMCLPGKGDCDGNTANGCEANLNTDIANCGGCGIACVVAHGTPSCNLGTCIVASCDAGYDDCNAKYVDGCETNLKTLSSCGSCGVQCSLANANATCATGTCLVSSCIGTFADCDMSPANGCEVDTSTNVGNCGACGNACTYANAKGVCSSSVCSMGACNAGFADCNANPSDGCETQVTDINNCGACGNACTNAHGTTSCTNAVCAPVCSSGFSNCDNNPSNGCETSITTNTNCGACGVSCSFANASSSCSTGACTFGSCNAGWSDCKNGLADGCETHTAGDPANCGGCGIACGAGLVCSNGQCVSGCAAGTADCDGNGTCETTTTSNGNNCGACGNACGAGNYCLNGSCAPCGAGTDDCDKDGTNGCEATVATDPNNCGACGTHCGSRGTCACAASVCSGGTVYYSEDFRDNAQGWTFGTEWGIGSAMVSPAGQQGNPDPGQDHSSTSDNGVGGIVIGGNYGANQHAGEYLVSPLIDLSSASGTITLTFWRWLNSDVQQYAQETVEVSKDGGMTWTQIWINKTGKNCTSYSLDLVDAAWTKQTFDISVYKSASFRLRFGHATQNLCNNSFAPWIMSGWNVDDVSISSATCN